MRSRSTAPSGRARCGPPMPDNCCSPVSSREDRARKVAADLMRPHFFTGWGIRTVARGEARYNPMSYHDGSIWPHDNALIALGLARYGLKHSVEHLFKGLFDAASYMDLRRLPELFCGFQRERRRGPTLYPVACAPQAWASATPFTLLEAALGLEFDVGTRRDPAARPAPAGLPQRGGVARSAARPVQRRSSDSPPRRGGVARGDAYARPDSGVDRPDALKGRRAAGVALAGVQEVLCVPNCQSRFSWRLLATFATAFAQTETPPAGQPRASARCRQGAGAAAFGLRHRRARCAWRARPRRSQRRRMRTWDASWT